VRQHICRTGGRGPAVVALPGFQEIGLTWARVAKRLEGDFDVIMVDFRGQGRTERGTATYSQSLLVADVAALLGEVGITRASVLGFSNGAGVAAELAATHRHLVSCAVLEDPPRNSGRTPAMAESRQYLDWHADWLKWLDQFRALSPDEQVSAIASQLPPGGLSWPNEELVALAESFAQLDVELVRDPSALWKVRNRAVSNLLSEISCPILIMESTRGMPGTPPIGAEPVLALSHVTRVPFDTSHFIRRERFDEYMALVEPFLRHHA